MNCKFTSGKRGSYATCVLIGYQQHAGWPLPGKTWKNLENPGKSWNWASPPGKSWNFAKCLKILENRSIFLKNLEFEVKKKKKNYILMINTHFEYSHTHPSHIHTHTLTLTLTFNDLIFFHFMCLLWYI